MSEINIHAKVKLADVLALLNAETCMDYLCHNVAYLMRQQIETVPGYAEYRSDFITAGDDHGEPKRIGAIPYYFLVDDGFGRQLKNHNPMSPQVITQMNQFMVRIEPEMIGIREDDLSENTLMYFRFKNNKYCCDCRENRIGALEKILHYYPDAVFEINL